jgi:heme oxygenase
VPNSAPSEPLRAIATLRSATGVSHKRLEKRLEIKRRFAHLSAYRVHLEKMWGFCAALEQQLGPQVFGDALDDYESRRKLPLLTQDLIAIGASDVSVASLPQCTAVPNCRETAAAFGCLYVSEGATLGGRTLLPLAQAQLGLTAQRGGRFLASYGEEVSSKWHRFGMALDSWCCTPERQARAAQAAVATFDALEVWLCGAHV